MTEKDKNQIARRRDRVRVTATNRATKKRAVIRAYARYGSLRVASEVAQISYDTVCRWNRTDPKFKMRIKAAYVEHGENIEGHLSQRAFGYPAQYDNNGKLIREEYRGSDTLLIFKAKGHFPDKYAERHETKLKGVLSLTDFFARPIGANDPPRQVSGTGEGEPKALPR